MRMVVNRAAATMTARNARAEGGLNGNIKRKTAAPFRAGRPLFRRAGRRSTLRTARPTRCREMARSPGPLGATGLAQSVATNDTSDTLYDGTKR